MKLRILILLTIFSSLFILSCNTLKKMPEKEFKVEHEDIRDYFNQEFERTKDPVTNTVPVDRLLIAKKRQNEFFSQQQADASISGISWEERGPNNVGGRIRAVLVDAGDPTGKKVWVGGVFGGLWFTPDITAATPIWNKINDFWENLAVNCIAQNPTNTQEIYIGTGEGVDNGAPRGLGIYKSTDGGLSWNRLTNTSSFLFVNQMVFDKNGKLYAAVRNDFNAAAGIERTANGGVSWTNVFTGPTTEPRKIGMDVTVSKDGDIYVSFGAGSTGAKGSIYLSNSGATAGDAGTWTNITPNSSGTITDPDGTGAMWQRIRLATAPSDNNVLYALFQGATSSLCESIQQYNKGSNTWTVRTVPKIVDQQANPANYPVFTRDQAWWGLTAGVDPNNPAVLCVSGIDACRSTDFGATWSQISTWALANATGFTSSQLVHADQHGFTFSPGSSSTAILATDGGIYYSTNINTGSGKPVFVAKNRGLNITQYYACSIHPTGGTNYFLGGTQDNGSQKFTQAGMNTTTDVSGGDGAYCHISPINAANQITSYTNNQYYISTDGGLTFPAAVVNNSRGSFINPTDYDGNNLYGGDNAGSFFRWLNPQGNAATGAPIAVAAFAGGNITSVTISPQTANRVYFGLNNGKIIRVDNANTSNAGVDIGSPRGGASVSCINSVAAKEDSMVVTYSNYGGSKIFVSANGTSATPAFTDITGNFPDMPVRWAVFDPRSSKMVFLGTELGVWSCDDITIATPDWKPTNNGLANTRVFMLKYRNTDRTLLAASHGRGMFTAVIPPNNNPEINFSTAVRSVAEQSSMITGTCRNYTDFDIFMNINGAPSGGDAVVTLNVAGGGTATEGFDFDYTTNSIFGAGSSKVLTFLSGSPDSKTFRLRVYDDAISEGTETFTFNFTTAGGGSSIGTSAPTLVISIADNDVTVAGPTSLVNNQIGANTDANGFTGPFSSNADILMDHYFLVTELSAAGMVAGSNITGLTFNIATKQSTAPFNNFAIRLGHITGSPTTASSFLVNTGLTPCFANASYNSVSGDNVFDFTTPFIWDGVSNVVVRYCYDNTVDGNTDIFQVKNDALGTGVRSVIWNYEPASSNAAGCSLPTNSFVNSSNRPVTRFKHYKPGTAIQTLLSETRTEFIQNGNNAYDFFSNGRLISKLSTVSQDLGCTKDSIVQAGNGFIAFGSGQRSNKAWQIIPSTNGSTASYTVTLYMTTAELAGQNVSGYQIYKSSSATIGGANIGNTITGATTVSTNAEWTSFTATFTGFSIFFIGSAGLIPIHWISVNGNIDAQKHTVISWKVNEQNVSRYEIEKSLDGHNFSLIGSVNSQGNGENSYHFTEMTVLQSSAFYRIRQVDKDGRYGYSTIIRLSTKNDQIVTIYPNPTKEMVTVNVGNNALNSQVRLLDATGKVLQSFTIPSTSFTINMAGYPMGTYLLRLESGASEKIVLQ